jgi:hypothetical protein
MMGVEKVFSYTLGNETGISSDQEVADELIRHGIKGIINFAPVLLKLPPDIIVNNVNLCNELESVIYSVYNLLKTEGLKNVEYSRL